MSNRFTKCHRGTGINDIYVNSSRSSSQLLVAELATMFPVIKLKLRSLLNYPGITPRKILHRYYYYYHYHYYYYIYFIFCSKTSKMRKMAARGTLACISKISHFRFQIFNRQRLVLLISQFSSLLGTTASYYATKRCNSF